MTRTYRATFHSVAGLQRVSLSVARGEVVAVMGPSGSGKSTLLFLLGGLERPDEGTVRVTGVDWATLDGKDRARFRRRACGFIAQGQALLPQATAAENVDVPLLLDHGDATDRRSAVAAALDRVGLGEHAGKLPDQLSGGEQQRVSIARALVGHPAVVLADEPTGSLDSANSDEIIRLLLAAAAERDTTVVLVTHDPIVAAHADRIVRLRSGQLDPDDGEKTHRGAPE